MESQCIPYTRVPKSSALLLDYLYHFDRVAQFYNGSPFDAESYRRLAENVKGLKRNRAELAAILERQTTAALERLEAALAEARSTGEDAEAAKVLLQDLRATYRPGATWGQAFGSFMARLFSRWGVVLLDPLDESIHRLAAPTYEQAITRARELRERLHARSQQLIAAGYHAQVRVGDDGILLFL